MQDSSIMERRLRPIYDCLESGNNKKALQEAEKALKKTPNILCFKALKALALLRMSRDEEADTLVGEIAAKNPSDDSTLQVMTFCYKEREEFSKICTLYSNAAKQNPGCEDILSHLFISYVRVNDFSSQQLVAMQLYKLKPKNPYYFWAVMSVVLKAVRGPDSKIPEKRKLLLTLAQRMIDKQISENKIDAEQEVQLYLSILKYQQKYAEALDFLEGDLGRKIYPGAPVELKIELLKSLDRWGECNVLLKDLLRENPDRWDYHKDYILSVTKLKQSSVAFDGADCTFEQCYEFLCQLIESGARVVRGPFLGRLELHHTMTDLNENASELLGDFLELLVEYFRKFGDKACCANDIILFLNFLEAERRAELASRLLEVCEISSTKLPQNKEQMQKHICSLQVSRICGAHALSTEHLAALYTAFSLHYEHGTTAFGSDLLPTDMGPSDSYALLAGELGLAPFDVQIKLEIIFNNGVNDFLAVHVMYDLSLKLQTSEHLIEALCLLHYLLSNSPSNFHAKLLCLQIYHLIGCGWGAHKTSESLEMKYVQLDSMGYLHVSQLPLIGIPSIAKPWYDSTLRFFTSSYKESLEYLAMCYKFGSFSKLEEFMDFRDKLSNSLHFLLISTEAVLLEFVCLCGLYAQNMAAIKAMKIVPSQDRIQWDQVTDNRDISVIVKWNAQTYPNADADMKRESFAQDVELVRIRSMLARIICGCVEAITHKETKNKDIETMKQLKHSWTDLWLRIRNANYKPTSNQYLVNLLPSRLHGIMAAPYEASIIHLIEMVLQIEERHSTAKLSCDALCDDFNLVRRLLCDTITEYNESSDLAWKRRNSQETIVNCIEVSAHSFYQLKIWNNR
ncbi:Phagocyte signaling-impaired protein [Pseudolycoriella hygida]|uniref:N-terminal acetyltransferase B complex subunit MDM20 homolog n=1 Tax=Pseudolycoriella hygida TaxID=35572 RepID=A0A9Q0RW88_9DIPT|nr:Phagocyte signaling-impaired protein [Pseudolycoriella hygida]